MSAEALCGPQQLQLDLQGGWSDKQAERFRRAHRRGFHRCESPIERQMALAFSRTDGFSWRRSSDPLWVLGHWPSRAMQLMAQVEWLSHRADFALVPAGWTSAKPIPLVVEVDGHDYHERTKEQAERDRRRDRLMTHSGATVLRFTGREVWRNAEACAAEVLDLAFRS